MHQAKIGSKSVSGIHTDYECFLGGKNCTGRCASEMEPFNNESSMPQVIFVDKDMGGKTRFLGSNYYGLP